MILLDCPTHLVWAAPVGWDTSRAEQLLQRNTIRELRMAADMIRQHPMQALELMPKIASRANHPELTKAFDFLLLFADESQLRHVLESNQSQRKSQIKAQLALREAGVPARDIAAGDIAMDDGGAPGLSATLPKNSTSVAAVNLNDRTPQRTAKPVNVDEVQKRLTTFAGSTHLSESDVDFVIVSLDGIMETGHSKATAMRLGLQNCLRRYLPGLSETLSQRLVSGDLQHPENFFPVVHSLRPHSPAILQWIWELVNSEVAEVRRGALSLLYLSPQRHDEYARGLLKMASVHPERAKELYATVGACAINATQKTREAVLVWLLDEIESSFDARDGASDRLGFHTAPTSAALHLAMKFDGANRSQFATEIIRRAEKSESPLPLIYVWSGFGIRDDYAASAIKKLMVRDGGWVHPLRLAKYLYLATDDASSVVPLFAKALAEPREDWHMIRIALEGIESVGKEAKELVPTLIELLTETDEAETLTLAVDAIGSIGPDAGQASDGLISLYDKHPDDAVAIEVVVALGRIGDGSRKQVEFLVSVADDSTEVKQVLAIEALLKIAHDAELFHSLLERLSVSENDRLSRLAQRRLEAIRSLPK